MTKKQKAVSVDHAGQSMHKPGITAKILRRSLRLLNMLYKPSELAEEVGITKQTVIRYTEKFNLPFSKDASGHIWINGAVFLKWAEEITEKLQDEHRVKTEYDFHCLKCNFVTVKSYESHSVNNPRGRTRRLTAICPKCNAKLSKFARIEND